jgi:hypothetical protein
MRALLVAMAGLAVMAAAPPPASAPAAPPAPDPVALVAASTRPFGYDGGQLSGPGAAFLETALKGSQFVLFGEDHYLKETPQFAAALYQRLHEAHGYTMLVVEQDHLAVADVLAPGIRGNAAAIGRQVGRYPQSFEFGSDQDIELLALAGRLEAGPQAICGAEQALGPVRYFDELLPLAPNAAMKAQVTKLRAEAVKADPDPKYSVNWLIAPGTPAALAALRKAWQPTPGSRPDELILGLERSAEIFGYYRRAEAGEPVGLYNNTVREAWMKRQFLACYRAAGGTPKVMFKYGSNHMGHGRNPTQAFPIGNLAHELAIVNGSSGYGLFVVPLRDGYKELPAMLAPLLPKVPPGEPVIVDLVALRPYQRVLRTLLPPSEVEDFRYLINGFEALVLLPGEAPATMTLSGLKSPFDK